jgi:flavorubredoxin
MRRLFPDVQEAVAQVIKPPQIRWIFGSHLEADEWGALNEWLDVAPSAQPICSIVGALVNVIDFASRPPRGLAQGEVIRTGKNAFRFCSTPHLPHGWDAGLLFEETQGMLLCSDLFHQNGDVESLTQSDVIERTRQSLASYQASPAMDYQPFTLHTQRLLGELAALKPKMFAPMHGSSFAGDGERALHDLALVMGEVYSM